MRICSFLPSATEILCALGLENDLVGISHECDYPPSVRNKPVIVRSVKDTGAMSPLEIDRYVSDRLRTGQSLYEIDEARLKEAKPDIIFSQTLCEVCAPAEPQVRAASAITSVVPKVVYLTAHSLADIWDNILEVGRATGKEPEAQELVAKCQERLDRVARKTETLPRPKIVFLEWLDPIYNAGHWVPDMVYMAGGVDELANPGKDSVRMNWNQVLHAQPEVLILSPCGYHTGKAAAQASLLTSRPDWKSLPAVRKKQVYVVDASAYFARPGPRVVEGVELLAHLLHPDVFDWTGPKDAFKKV